MSDRREKRDAQFTGDAAPEPMNRVDETSEESFPASDSPAWAPPSRIGPVPRDGEGDGGTGIESAQRGGGNPDVGPAVDRALDAGRDDRRD